MYPITGTPCVSRYSIVFGISKIDLTPEQTTATLVFANSIRSADISSDSFISRCTPPIPPVAKTLIFANDAMIMVAATVVAP